MTRAEWAKRKGRSAKWIAKERRLALYLRGDFRCAYCLKDLARAKPSEIHLDHLVARAHGGTHHERNLVPACARCNCRKQHAKSWRAFVRELRGKSGGEDGPAERAIATFIIRRIERQRRRKLNMALAKSIVTGKTTESTTTRSSATSRSSTTTNQEESER
jgi:hypothetical protein